MNTLESPFSEAELDTLKCVPSRQIARFCSISHATIDKISKISDFADCRIGTINEIKRGIKMYTIAEYAKKCSVEFDESNSIYAITLEIADYNALLEWLDFEFGEFRLTTEHRGSHLSTNQADECKQFLEETGLYIEDVFNFYLKNHVNNNIEQYRIEYEVNLYDLAKYCLECALDDVTADKFILDLSSGSVEFDYYHNTQLWQPVFIDINLSPDYLREWIYETPKSKWLADDTIKWLAGQLKDTFYSFDNNDLVNFPINFKLVGA